MTNCAIRSTILVLAALVLGRTPLPAQTLADSVAGWTTTLENGTLLQRVTAVAHLAHVQLGALPPASRSALAAELARLNDAMLNNQPIDGAPDLGSEGFGEYYLDLATTVARFNTPEATRALILSVGVSFGTERKVAELGDEAVPVLADMIDHHYQSGDALETLALAWFWSDSTGAPLSDASRLTIVRRLAAGTHSDQYGTLVSMKTALGLIGDPAYLPIAQRFASDLAGTEANLARRVRVESIPALKRTAGLLTRANLLDKTGRILSLLCSASEGAPPAEICMGLTAQLDSARDLLALNTIDESVIHLNRVAAAVDAAVSVGALTADDSVFIAGGAELVAGTVPSVPAWAPGVAYAVGDSASYNGLYYQTDRTDSWYEAAVGPPR